MTMRFENRNVDFSSRTHIMGVLNVTPDSFSDGGKFFKSDDAVRQGMKMIEEGADTIDVGGESTRPGSDPLPTEEELSRVIPVIKSMSAKTDVPISIDTYKAEVAKRA
ncbi:MAG: dihydropteroate synthase, partial [Candidatus Zixiibacteriota bacterium]